MKKPSIIKGILSALLTFIFCLVFIPAIVALILPLALSWMGEGYVSLASIILMGVVVLMIPFSFWAAWKRYRTFNPRNPLESLYKNGQH